MPYTAIPNGQRVEQYEEYDLVMLSQNYNNNKTEGGKERVRKISRKQSIRQEFITGRKKEEYMRSFTIHGLTKICRGSRAESIFWSSIIFIGLALTGFLIHRLVTKYLKYEIYTELYQKTVLYNDFPGITFCNEMLLLGSYFTYCGKPHMLGFSNQQCQHTTIKFKDRKDVLKDVPTEWSNEYFHVKLCRSHGKQICSNDNHLLSVSKHNHACFTWNHNGSFHDVYSHLSLQFALNKSSKIAHGKIIAFVHDPRIVEVDYTNQISLEPLKTYLLNIRKSHIKRLPSPFPSKCVNNIDRQIFPGKYTRRMCIDSINYINMYKKCGDVMDYHRDLIPQSIVDKYKQNMSIKEAVECFRDFSQTKVEVTNECPFPCEEIEYHTTAMSHQLDSIDEETNHLLYRLEIQLQNVDSYEVIEEKQLYTWDQVLGEVGGLLGLLVGASIISFIEVFAYCYLALIQKCIKVCSKDN